MMVAASLLELDGSFQMAMRNILFGSPDRYQRTGAPAVTYITNSGGHRGQKRAKSVAKWRSRAPGEAWRSLYGDPRHDVALENPVNDLDAVDDLGEHGVVAVEAQVVLEVDEPLSISGVVAARAHANRAPHVRHGAELIAKVLRQPHVLVLAGTSPLNDEVMLDAMPAEPVVVACTRKSKNARGHHRRDIPTQPHEERSATPA